MSFDFNEVKDQVKKVITYSQGIENPQIDELMDKWLESKRDFIEAMNGNLIYEYPVPVKFELGKEEKNLRICDFIDMVDHHWLNSDLAAFIEKNSEGFFSNSVIADYQFSGKTIPKGMKLLKAFKYFEKDKKALDDIQSAASMIIQEDSVEGILCFSVHPLDYLSSSENNHNWRSCHALDGDYRAGNLSYMVDKSTVICYLKSKASNKNEKLPDFPPDVPWNDKKWRVLLFFSEHWDIMFAGRQYPFFANSALDFIRDNIIAKLTRTTQTSRFCWGPWQKNILRKFEEDEVVVTPRDAYIPLGDDLIKLKDLIINEYGSLQFNDLLSSHCYSPMYCVKSERIKTFDYGNGSFVDITRYRHQIHNPNTNKFFIGGPVKCCRCGKNLIELSETFMCNSCEALYGDMDDELFRTCDCCGNRFYADDGYFVDTEDEIVCPHCAETATMVCPHCGERTYKNDAIYNKELGETVCRFCDEEFVFND